MGALLARQPRRRIRSRCCPARAASARRHRRRRPRRRAEYLASVIARQSGRDRIQLQDPAASRRASRPRVIITEYDLPRKEAHAARRDRRCATGMAWYSDFGSQFVGVLDPKTGEVKDIPIPVLKPEQPKGGLDIEFDPTRQCLALDDVPGRHHQDRPQDPRGESLRFPEGVAVALDAGVDGVAAALRRRRQGVDQQPGGPLQPTGSTSRPASSRTWARPRIRAASRSAPTACRPTSRTTSISSSSAARASAIRDAKTGQVTIYRHADQRLAAAPRPGR